MTSPLTALEPFVGEWSMAAAFGDTPPADAAGRLSFEWLPGQRFLIQRWEVPVPEAPDGIAIIGADPARDGGYLQHYFDSRGVERVYAMSVDGGTWKLWREAPGFSQRFAASFSDDGTTITGAWELSRDGETWERDFGIVYTRVDQRG